MKNSLKINEVHQLSFREEIIFITELNIDEYHKRDIFSNAKHNLKFELKGIGSDFDKLTNTVSLLVDPISEYGSLDDFKEKVFLKEI